MKWPTPRTILALTVFLGILGFGIGGVIAAFQERSVGTEEIAALAALLGAIAGGVVGYEAGKRD